MVGKEEGNNFWFDKIRVYISLGVCYIMSYIFGFCVYEIICYRMILDNVGIFFGFWILSIMIKGMYIKFGSYLFLNSCNYYYVFR